MTMLHGLMIVFGAVFVMYFRTLIYLKGGRGFFIWLMALLCLIYGCS